MEPGGTVSQPQQMEAVEEDPFAYEMRSSSTSSVGATCSVVVSTAAETASLESSKATSDATIPLEGKEAKRRGRPRKEEKKSAQGPSHHEKDTHTWRRDDSDSEAEGEGNGNADNGNRSGSRKGNRKKSMRK